ncbi:hypothetical protein [Longimicrobium sp.]|uniref:hypothetical protein n=1 Tax=Longimicrobium sp. TaxID=2029185 RepID=UPI002ED9C4B3
MKPRLERHEVRLRGLHAKPGASGDESATRCPDFRRALVEHPIVRRRPDGKRLFFTVEAAGAQLALPTLRFSVGYAF